MDLETKLKQKFLIYEDQSARFIKYLKRDVLNMLIYSKIITLIVGLSTFKE